MIGRISILIVCRNKIRRLSKRKKIFRETPTIKALPGQQTRPDVKGVYNQEYRELKDDSTADGGGRSYLVRKATRVGARFGSFSTPR